MKKIICVILSVVLALSFGSCAKKASDKQTKKADEKKTVQGNSTTEPAKSADAKTSDKKTTDTNTADPKKNTDATKESENVTPVKESKAFTSFFNIISGNTYFLEMKIENVPFTVAVKGDKSYDVSFTEGGTAIIIKKDKKKYLLSPDNKTYSVTQMTESELKSDSAKKLFDGDLYNGKAFTTGKTEIDGKSYDTEEFLNQGITSKFCFLKDQLKYIVLSANNQENKIEVVKVSASVPDSLFDIPADYKEATTN